VIETLQPAEPMPVSLEPWPRPHYAPTDGTALLVYAAYGSFDLSEPLSATKYQSNGPPPGFDLSGYDRATQPDVLARFCQGYAWDHLRKSDRRLATQIEKATDCIVLRGEASDPPTLDYLRDAVGTITYLFDCGAVAVYDPQTLRWWTPAEWRAGVFEPTGLVPAAHVVVLQSDEPGGAWFHTRGMRKFARPDVSVRAVGPAYRDAVIDLCNRFIEFMAFGGRPVEGEAIRMKSLPAGGAVRHAGDLDDPDFNNVHMELVWPGHKLAGRKRK
jgi:hypothetical protein